MSPVRRFRARPLVPALAALALAVTGVVAGCGGGGGGGEPAPVAAAPDALLSGFAAPAGLTAADALAALGTMAAPDQATVLASVRRYDRFGPVRDPFRPLVSATPPAAAPGIGTLPTTGLPGSVIVPPVTGLPLIPGTTTVPSIGGGVTPAPVATPTALEADVDVSGEPLVVREGDAIPPDSQEFRVERLRSGTMTLKLAAGLLPDGTDTFTVKVGERVTLYDQSARRTYRVRLNAVRKVT